MGSGNGTTFVIMGATGDLTQRKLLPALFNLGCKGRLPGDFKVVGFARSAYTDQEFREFSWQRTRELGDLRALREEWEEFARQIFYVSGDLNSAADFELLKSKMEAVEVGGQANRVYYLSVAPQLFEATVSNLGASSLNVGESGKSRVVFEKPFGSDLRSAQALSDSVHQIFYESQVYRIDHYLGKETVQNLLEFRFANTIFEPAWNRSYIDNIQVTVAEKVTAGERAGYYDGSGVVRDMVQNHLLQLVTMVAMEPPSALDQESLRD